VIREALETVRWNGRFPQFWALLRTAVKDEYRRHGSKRARDWPHKKRESPPGPPFLRRLNRNEKARIERLWSDNATVLG